MPDDIEKDYEKLVRSLYDKLREDIEMGEVTPSRAEDLADMIAERTGIVDTNKQAWDHSSWCYYGESQEDDGWNESGCSI